MVILREWVTWMIQELKKAWKFLRSAEFWRMAVLWTLSLLYSYLRLFSQSFLSFAMKRSQAYDSYKHLSHCTSQVIKPLCIITGATSGLGAAAALALSKHGFYVILVGRSRHLLLKTMSEIKKQNENALLKAFQVDLLSIQSILNFRISLQLWLRDSRMHPSVQLLINNAGILATSARLTSEGYDQMMATNYIGPFFFTQTLLPLLKNNPGPSRIVNVTSFTHRCVFAIQVDEDTITGKCFGGLDQYPYAHIYEYSKSFAVLKISRLLQLPQEGVSCILDAALASAETSGVYFFGGKGRTVKSSALSYNKELAEELWTTSLNLFLNSPLAIEGTNDLDATWE